MMDCKNCKENYLYQIYKECLAKNELNNDALEEFNLICTRCHDPRSSIRILYNIIDNDCEDCKRFKQLYQTYFNQRRNSE